MRTASLVQYLARHYDIDLITFREPRQPDPRDAIPTGLIRRVTVVDLPIHGKGAVARATRNLGRLLRGVPPLVDRFAGFDLKLGNRRYDLGLVEHLWCAPYAEALRPHCSRLVLDLHNIESRLLSTSAATVPAPASLILRSFSRMSRAIELTCPSRYDSILVCSPEDQEALGGSSVYFNAIPWRKQPEVARSAEVIAFSANFDYAPNRSAVQFFATKVWPLLLQRKPTLKWRLIGRNESWARAYLASSPNVEFTGPVDDPVLNIAAATIAVAPILAGSGTRIKILEAWAAGTPVVSTALGAEGLDAVDGQHLLLADDALAFTRKVTEILDSPELAAKLSAAGRVLYEQRYTWDAVWEALDQSRVLSPSPAVSPRLRGRQE